MSEQECRDAIKLIDKLVRDIEFDSWSIGRMASFALDRIRYRIEQRLDEILDAQWSQPRW